MAGVRIVTDSSCDLTPQEADELGVAVVPLSIRFGSDEYTDRRDLSVSDFYKKMAASEALPETAAPSPGAFEEAFRQQADAGAGGIVCVTISSELSGTLQSAQAAAKSVSSDLPVRVVDSRSITSGLGTQVILAARAAADGADVDAVSAVLDDAIARTRVFGVLNTLDNLKKGGRIGGAKALMGSILAIKPIVDISTGAVEEAGKARTRRKAFQWMRDRILQDGAVEHLAVMDGEAADVQELLDLLAGDFPAGSIRTGRIGPVIGTHGGPAVVGATWLAPAR
jgi:DegV family protein with EDD domain